MAARSKVAPIDVLFVCTGNMFRSVMAQSFLGKIALDRSIELTVHSAGTLDGERVVAPETLELIGAHGTDMSAHRSTLIDAGTIGRADLIVGMTREHVREIVLIEPGAFARTFTLKELVRKGEGYGRRASDQPISDWLASVGRSRRREDLIGWSSTDDIEDPAGGGLEQLKETAAELRQLVHRLVEVIEPKS